MSLCNVRSFLPKPRSSIRIKRTQNSPTITHFGNAHSVATSWHHDFRAIRNIPFDIQRMWNDISVFQVGGIERWVCDDARHVHMSRKYYARIVLCNHLSNEMFDYFTVRSLESITLTVFIEIPGYDRMDMCDRRMLIRSSTSVSLISGYVWVNIFVLINRYRFPTINELCSLNAFLKRFTFRSVTKSLRSPPMSLSPGMCIRATFDDTVANTLRKRSAYRACASSVARLPSSIKSPMKQMTSGAAWASARLNVLWRYRSESVFAMW